VRTKACDNLDFERVLNWGLITSCTALPRFALKRGIAMAKKKKPRLSEDDDGTPNGPPTPLAHSVPISKKAARSKVDDPQSPVLTIARNKSASFLALQSPLKLYIPLSEVLLTRSCILP
jgi:hypothetical protein